MGYRHREEPVCRSPPCQARPQDRPKDASAEGRLAAWRNEGMSGKLMKEETVTSPPMNLCSNATFFEG